MGMQMALLTWTLTKLFYAFLAPGFEEIYSGFHKTLIWKCARASTGYANHQHVEPTKGCNPTSSCPGVYTKGSGRDYSMLTLFVDDLFITGPSNKIPLRFSIVVLR